MVSLERGFLLAFVSRALLLESCLSPEPWSLQNRGHCKVGVTAKSWSLQNRGHCEVGVTAKSGSLQSRCRLRNASYLVSRLGPNIGASRSRSKDSVLHRVDEASMGLIAKSTKMKINVVDIVTGLAASIQRDITLATKKELKEF